MPLELGAWRIDAGCIRIEVTSIFDEARLESLLNDDISIVSPNWMVIGRQVRTDYGTFIDLLAIDRDGNLIVIELKREKTPRDVVAQTLDYASWVKKLDDDDIGRIFSAYLSKYHPDRAKQSLDDAFRTRFNVSEMPEALNESHELVVVAAALDDSTERIVKYLADDHGVAINAVFFRVFRDEGREYLTRAWMLDPTETAAPITRTNEEWNGEYYVSFGQGDDKDWEDAKKFGFVCASGGSWYTQTLHMLEPGNRIWVNIPSHGYVGVGIVQKTVVKVDEFMVGRPDGTTSLLTQSDVQAPKMFTRANDPELAPYLVGVKWLKTVPLKKPIKERGFFGNQNTVCQPTSKKWAYTVERLKQRFGIED